MKSRNWWLLLVLILAGSFFIPAKSPSPAPEPISADETVVVDQTAAASVTLTPAPGSLPLKTLVAAAVPTPRTDLSLGNAKLLRDSIKEKSTKQIYDLRIGAGLGVPGVGLYCENIQIADKNMPWGRYGNMTAKMGKLYPGVESAVFQNPDNIKIESVRQEPTRENDDNGNPVLKVKDKARVTLIVREWGILEPGYMPGDSVYFTVDKPGLIWQAWIDPWRQVLTGESILYNLINRVNQKSGELAEYDVLSTDNLEQAKELLQLSLTRSSGNPKNHSVYDNLVGWFEEAAKAAGYVGLESLTVQFEPEPGYYFLESMVGEGPRVGVHDYYDPSQYKSTCTETEIPQDKNWRRDLLKSINPNSGK